MIASLRLACNDQGISTIYLKVRSRGHGWIVESFQTHHHSVRFDHLINDNIPSITLDEPLWKVKQEIVNCERNIYPIVYVHSTVNEEETYQVIFFKEVARNKAKKKPADDDGFFIPEMRWVK
jgi:hypothetical protein